MLARRGKALAFSFPFGLLFKFCLYTTVGFALPFVFDHCIFLTLPDVSVLSADPLQHCRSMFNRFSLSSQRPWNLFLLGVVDVHTSLLLSYSVEINVRKWFPVGNFPLDEVDFKSEKRKFPKIKIIINKLNLFKKKSIDINKYDKHLISKYIFIYFFCLTKIIIYLYIFRLFIFEMIKLLKLIN